jgi:hypothetical protein
MLINTEVLVVLAFNDLEKLYSAFTSVVCPRRSWGKGMQPRGHLDRFTMRELYRAIPSSQHLLPNK